tara:strand:- start:9 stop:1706 length:1698 start_codon:yes stop_codon:yes gene_type:complete
MAINIKYFNSFVLKKNVNNITSNASRSAYIPVFPGLPWDPVDYPIFPSSSANASGRTNQTSSIQNDRNWIIEESRIRGGFNEVETGYGVRAYLRENSSEQSRRSNALIYSGVFNSITDLNETNVFSVGEEITKAVDPNYGSIQKIHALDSNLAIFQENKISRGLIDKDAIYSAEGSSTVTSTNLVIGQVTPYVGEYGISKNPESFANFGSRRYFVDKYRGKVMRLSNDGLTEISGYGMSDFFRDNLSEIIDTFIPTTIPLTYAGSTSTNPFRISVTQANASSIEKGMQVEIPQTNGTTVIATVVGILDTTKIFLSNNPGLPISTLDAIKFTKYNKEKVIGGWDNYNSNYTVSLQKQTNFTGTEDTFYYTVSFEEDINGWVSLFTYKPRFLASLKNKYYTINGSELYEHYSNQNRNEFYGVRSESNITFVFNANPSIQKVFKTVNYEGTNGWEVDSFISDAEGFDLQGINYREYNDKSKPVKSYDEGVYVENGVEYRVGFNRKENKYFANLVSDSTARPGEVLFGNETTGVKGFFTTVKVSTDATTDVDRVKELFAVSTEFVVSSR